MGARVPAPIVAPAGKPLPSFTLADGMTLTLLSPGPAQLERLGREWQQVLLELQRKKDMLSRKPRPPQVKDFAKFDLKKLAGATEKPDRSAPNGSSIALLAEFEGRSVLLGGDAHASVLLSAIRALQRERGQEGTRLKLDAFKLSHHGSANATTTALLSAVDCPRYLVSSNGNIFYHPDRETIARVILHGGQQPTLLFNYRSPFSTLWEEPSLQQRYGYRTVYPKSESAGLRVTL